MKSILVHYSEEDFEKLLKIKEKLTVTEPLTWAELMFMAIKYFNKHNKY